MKNALFFFLILPVAEMLQGQTLRLTGSVGSSDAASAEVNLMPFGTHYFKDYSIIFAPDNNGNFHFVTHGNKEIFVWLRYAGKETWLLLGPGRPLHVRINTTKSKVFAFSGKGAPENNQLQQLRPTELYFDQQVRYGKGANPYMKLSADSMRTVVFPMVMHSLDSALTIIRQSELPSRVKEALRTEIRFYYFRQFADLAWSGWHFSHHHLTGFFRIIDTALAVYGLPSKEDLDSGIPSTFDYMNDGYFSLHALEGNYSRKDVLHARDSLGYVYADLVAAQELLPAYAFEKWLAMDIQFWVDYGDLFSATLMLRDLRSRFPDDGFIKPFSQKIAALQQLKDSHEENAKIRFRQDDAGIHSIRQLLLPYKGKVVFLDFWGTWCGYCMDEIRNYGKPLQERYEGKEVVFLYVALDDDADKEKWENDIYLYNMEGEHLRISRKNKAQMDSIRMPLDAGEQEKRFDAYPSYYIFDRDGNPAVKNANLPSSGPLLFRQLDSVLAGRKPS